MPSNDICHTPLEAADYRLKNEDYSRLTALQNVTNTYHMTADSDSKKPINESKLVDFSEQEDDEEAQAATAALLHASFVQDSSTFAHSQDLDLMVTDGLQNSAMEDSMSLQALNLTAFSPTAAHQSVSAQFQQLITDENVAPYEPASLNDHSFGLSFHHL